MDNRFMRNIPALSESDQTELSNKRVLIVGCGGLGGYICECLVRAGVGHITVADGDVFEETNLNRQLLSTDTTLGMNKAIVAKERAKQINPCVDFIAHPVFFSCDNADELMEGADIVIDALDSIDTRLTLEDECAERDLVMVHGAVSGWNAQVCTVLPGSRILHRLYENSGETADKSCVCPTPALCASIQAAEAIKLLCGKTCATQNKLLIADLKYMTFDLIEMV